MELFPAHSKYCSKTLQFIKDERLRTINIMHNAFENSISAITMNCEPIEVSANSTGISFPYNRSLVLYELVYIYTN